MHVEGRTGPPLFAQMFCSVVRTVIQPLKHKPVGLLFVLTLAYDTSMIIEGK